MALILCIESSADYCSVCIANGEVIIASAKSDETYAHSKYLAVLIKTCIEQSHMTLQDMDAVALSAGPGSYTSLRVGASLAKGICYTISKPLITIPSLHIIAYPFLSTMEPSQLLIPTIDARRDEAYITVIDADMKEVEALQAHIFIQTSFMDLIKRGHELIFCGNAADKASRIITELSNQKFIQSEPSAQNMVSLAQQYFASKSFADVAYFQPEYLKSPNITTPKKSLIP